MKVGFRIIFNIKLIGIFLMKLRVDNVDHDVAHTVNPYGPSASAKSNLQ